MGHIITVSLSENDYNFVQKHKKDKDCSPTFLLRNAILEKKQQYGEEIADTLEDVRDRLKANIKIRDDAFSFIRNEGLEDAWLTFIQKRTI